MIDVEREKQLGIIRAKMRRANELTLEQEPLKPAVEYFTQEEMAKFRKPKTKKIKKLRRREFLKAEDLFPDVEDKDFGSR